MPAMPWRLAPDCTHGRVSPRFITALGSIPVWPLIGNGLRRAPHPPHPAPSRVGLGLPCSDQSSVAMIDHYDSRSTRGTHVVACPSRRRSPFAPSIDRMRRQAPTAVRPGLQKFWGDRSRNFRRLAEQGCRSASAMDGLTSYLPSGCASWNLFEAAGESMTNRRQPASEIAAPH